VSDRPRTLYYAFGGGLGHGTRVLAVARQLARLTGGCQRILVNSAFADTLQTEAMRIPDTELRRLDPAASPTTAARYVAAQLDEFRPHVLVVDTFPRGLGGELVELLQSARVERRVLIGRQLPRRYVVEYKLRPFADAFFDLILIPGEDSPYTELSRSRRLEPFLIRDADELPPRREARVALAAPEGSPVVLVVGSGTEPECREMAVLAEELQNALSSGGVAVRLALPPSVAYESRGGDFLVRHYPLIEYLPAVDIVIGQAGYNLAHETHSVGVRSLLIARTRKYDRQQQRHYTYADVPQAEALARTLSSMLRQPVESSRCYANGACAGAQLIQRQLRWTSV